MQRYRFGTDPQPKQESTTDNTIQFPSTGNQVRTRMMQQQRRINSTNRNMMMKRR